MIDYLSKFSLKGKTAFVAGGAGLIGAEISKALASAGARTVILDINDEKGLMLKDEIKSNGFNADYERFDVTDLRSEETEIDRLIGKYGVMDIWVNVFYPRTGDWGDPVEKLDIDSFEKNIDMHMTSYVWLTRIAALKMKKSEVKGTIINFGSIYGMVGNDLTVYEGSDITPPMAYAAIKGGIINSTRYMASYFGKDGIRVNNVCPGGIFDDQEGSFVRNYEKKVPMGRMGASEEIASVVLFLSSEAASYITGASIVVDGGWTII